jgi:hypothetical protein
VEVPLKLDAEFSAVLATAPTGADFRINVPVEHDLEALKFALMTASGRSIVLYVRFGPLEVATTATGFLVTCPIDPVDKALESGSYTLPTEMPPNQYVYQGSLIERVRKFDA